MKRHGKLSRSIMALATGAIPLQFTDCSADVANLVIDGANTAVQVIAAAAIDAFFLSLGDPTRLTPVV